MQSVVHNYTLAELQAYCAEQLQQALLSYCNDIPAPDLKSAMLYVLSSGGKHLRPLLVYATGAIFKAPLDNLLLVASALELLHTYSLIHDDLPCMDDADLRRSQPTCHKVHGEAMAILTGDGLQTLAFQLLATQPATLTSEQRLQIISVLTLAAGTHGMVSGQVLDIRGKIVDLPSLDHMYQLKTGALLAASVECGRLCGHSSPEDQIHLDTFARCLGLAFQIQDDILDVESTTSILGKPQQIDKKNNKTTYPSLLGLSVAKAQCATFYQQAHDALAPFGERATLLRELTNLMLNRLK